MKTAMIVGGAFLGGAAIVALALHRIGLKLPTPKRKDISCWPAIGKIWLCREW